MKKNLIVTISMIFVAVIGYLIADNVIVKEVRAQAEHVLFENADELAQDSDIIVKVIATGKSENIIIEDNGYTDGRTNTEVVVSSIIKGDATSLNEDEAFTVTEPYFMTSNGVQPGKTVYFYEDYTPLQEGTEYILFLVYSEGTDSYWVNSLNQGKFNVDQQDKVEEEIMEHNDQYSELKLDVLKTFN